MVLRVLQFLVGAVLSGGGGYLAWTHRSGAVNLFPPGPDGLPLLLLLGILGVTTGIVFLVSAVHPRPNQKRAAADKSAREDTALNNAEAYYSQSSRAADRDWRSAPITPPPAPAPAPVKPATVAPVLPPPATVKPATIMPPPLASVPIPPVQPAPAPATQPPPPPKPVAQPAASVAPPPAPKPPELKPATPKPPAQTATAPPPPPANPFPSIVTLAPIPRPPAPIVSAPPIPAPAPAPPISAPPAPPPTKPAPSLAPAPASEGPHPEIRAAISAGQLNQAEQMLNAARETAAGLDLAHLTALAGDHAAAAGEQSHAKWLWRLAMKRFGENGALGSPDALRIAALLPPPR